MYHSQELVDSCVEELTLQSISYCRIKIVGVLTSVKQRYLHREKKMVIKELLFLWHSSKPVQVLVLFMTDER